MEDEKLLSIEKEVNSQHEQEFERLYESLVNQEKQQLTETAKAYQSFYEENKLNQEEDEDYIQGLKELINKNN